MSPWTLGAAGLVLLVAGGELLVRGASRLAALRGVSPLVVGLTIVAFGTSAPELAVSLLAVRAEAADVAVGNVVGSNIFNVLFILGVSAALVPLLVTRRIVVVEVPVVIGVSGVAWLCASDGRIGSVDGVILLLIAAVYTTWLLRGSAGVVQPDQPDTAVAPGTGTMVSALTAVAGLALLVLGARWLVDGAVAAAAMLGISEAVTGLTVVAAGTSLPEVAASVVATLRGERDIAVGNVLGSNIFNLTVILGTTAVVAGGVEVASGILRFDMPVMTAVAIACLPIFFTGHAIARWEGALFLALYVAYTAYLVLDATGHAALPHYRDAMLLFVLPLAAVTLVVLAVRAAFVPRRRH
jgi:cation:H+ antiporter